MHHLQIRPLSISIHAPPRGATKGRAHGNIGVTTFQFTPLREGRRTFADLLGSARRLFQFTPLREGRPYVYISGSARNISIHAPPRGATQRQRWLDYQADISIHAPPRGATPCKSRSKRLSKRFQFTPLREGRHPLHECNMEGIFISIHAPPRGATSR